MPSFVPKPELADGEQILLEPSAERQVANRGIGGRLYVTDRRFVFLPNVLYRFSRVTPWIAPFDQVVRVGEAERMLDQPLSGGLRHRLLVATADGREELFVINHLAQLEGPIRDAVVAGGGAAAP